MNLNFFFGFGDNVLSVVFLVLLSLLRGASGWIHYICLHKIHRILYRKSTVFEAAVRGELGDYLCQVRMYQLVHAVTRRALLVRLREDSKLRRKPTEKVKQLYVRWAEICVCGINTILLRPPVGYQFYTRLFLEIKSWTKWIPWPNLRDTVLHCNNNKRTQISQDVAQVFDIISSRSESELLTAGMHCHPTSSRFHHCRLWRAG